MKKNKLEEYIDNAISNNDFSKVGEIIEKSIDMALDLSKSGLNVVMNTFNLKPKQKPNYIANKDPQLVTQKKINPKNYFALRNICYFICAVMLFGSIVSLNQSLADLFSGIMFGLGFGFVGFLSHIHASKLQRFLRYKTEIGDNKILSVEDFASAVNLPVEKCSKELIYFINKRYFPQARIVENGNLFLLDRTSYDAYKAHCLNETKIEQEDKKELESNRDITNYITMTEQLIESIHDYDFKNDVVKLKDLLVSINHQIQKDGSDVNGLNKFVDYYTPTAINLVKNYIQFENEKNDILSVEKSQEDIKNAIENINEAFAKLLTDLYSDDILNINSEIEVMNTLLSQDGLIEKNTMFKKGNN
ncbi:5-bromo-4-chloroindolyl phosphate hydrolysis family protein [uncultured Finegoldia sp.]|uniref:5-bromo-4-chloroindolyl phosphate hydrolysis family protein n=1 Tax=uncultured Finegoldia sp. TaxID=328009 RepID=UPI00260FB639|nr:5-bromo-4-chloroindolyl phosphate hydrolysis family protein [uncultured Finegoldia sp.]